VTSRSRDSSGTKFDSYLDHWDENGDHIAKDKGD